MRLKISLFDKCMIKSDLKRFWWVGALYTVLLIFSLPLQHMLQVLPLKEDWQKEALLNSLRFSSNTIPVSINMQVLLICTLPVFLAVMLFSYLHSTRAATTLHSLPLSRITLLGSHAASGMLLISVPVLATAGLLAALASFTGLGEYYSIINVAAWAGLTLLFNILFFSIAVFVGIFTGNAIAHIVFTYIFNVLPYGLYMLVAYSLEKLLFGFSADSLSSGWAQSLPIVKVTGFIFSQFTFVHGLIYLLTAFIFFVIAGLAYKARKLETAGNIIAFRTVQPVFKYGVAVCLMLSGGYIAGYIINSGRTAVIAAYFIFAAVGYWMSQMLLEKTVRVWHAYKGFLLFNAAVILLLVGISADITGYVKRVPALDKIESAYIGDYGSWLLRKNNPPETALISAVGFFKEEVNIKAVMSLQSVLANGGGKADSLDGRTAYMAEGGSFIYGRDEYIVYTLKDGRSIVRKYTIDEYAVRDLLKPLYESTEYKEEKYPVFRQNARDIKLIEIGDRRTAKRALVLSDEERIQSFIDIMKKELTDADYEEVTEPESGYAGYIHIIDQNGVRSDYSLRRSFNSIFSWLEDNGYYNSVMLLPEEIDHVSVQALKTTWYKNGGFSYTDVGSGVNLSGGDIIKELIDICSPTLSNMGYGTCFRLEFYSRAETAQPDFEGFISSGAPMSEALRQKLGEIGGSPETVGK